MMPGNNVFHLIFLFNFFTIIVYVVPCIIEKIYNNNKIMVKKLYKKII